MSGVFSVTVPTGESAPNRVSSARVLQAALALAVLAALGVALYREREAFGALRGLPLWNLGLIVVGTVGAWVVNVASVRLLLGLHGLRTSYGELLALHAAAGLLNHLPFRTGTAFRALYYRRRSGLAWSAVGSVMTLHALTQIAGGGLIGLAATLSSDRGSLPLAAGFAVLAVGPWLGLIPRFRPSGRPTSLGRLRDRVAAELARARQGRARLAATIVLGCAGGAFGGLRLWAAYDALGLDVGFAAATIVGCAGPLTLMVSITPAALGVAEFLVVGLGALVDVAAKDGLVAAIVVRAVVTACFLLVGLPSLAFLRKRMAGKP